jgi:predicted Fe-Mo cluster-binding NifX family protein
MPCQYPGGPDGTVAVPLEESEVLNYYEVHGDGSFEQVAQTRQCAGACSDVVEGIARRGVKTIIVAGISPNSLLKFKNAGIRVLKANSRSVRELMYAFATNSLEGIGIDQFAKSRR